MKIIFTSFEKKTVNSLPRILFPGKMIVIDKAEDTDAAVEYLLGQDILECGYGDDQVSQGYALPGIAAAGEYRDTCYLFRLHLTGMTPAIIRFLEDKRVPKVGLSWHDDILQLHRRCDFAGYFIELQDVAKKFGIKDMSLQKIYANLFHQKISKAQRLSNWEAQELREAQCRYAATDAWCCIHLYEEFNRLCKTDDYELVES